MKTIKDFSPEARAQAIAERKNISFRAMTQKEINKMENKTTVSISKEEKTHYEMLHENAKNNLPSSMR